jgi:hypothetical protein
MLCSVVMQWLYCADLVTLLFANSFGYAGTPPASEQVAVELQATSAEVHSAQISAVEMYTRLLACASDEHIHAADAAYSAVGLVQPSSISLAEARAGAGTKPSMPATSSTGGPQHRPDQLPMLSMLPPDFARHCAAISAWGFNLQSLRGLLNGHLFTLCAEHMVGDADHFIP